MLSPDVSLFYIIVRPRISTFSVFEWLQLTSGMAPIVTGVHIYRRNESSAVDNYFIYLGTTAGETFSDALRKIKKQHELSDGDVLYKPHGITVVDDDIVFTVLQQQKKIFCIENECKVSTAHEMLHVTALVGCGESRNVDGVGADASFLQPTGICSVGNTLIAIDSGNKSVRLVTSLQPLIKYLSVIQKMYKTFSIHPEIIGRGSSDDLQKGIEYLSEISIFLNEMNLQAVST